MSRTTQYVGDIDFAATHFAPAQLGEKMSVLVYRSAEAATQKGGRLEFQLCSDSECPLTTRYGIDSVRDGESSDRRGLVLKIEEPKAVAALQQLDEVIIKTAIERSKEWFKKPLTREQVEARYKNIVSKARDDDPFHVMKVKIKTEAAKVPTELHLKEEGGHVRKHGGRVADLERPGAEVVPVVSGYSLWFMGGGAQFGMSFQVERMIVRPSADADNLDSGFVSSKPIVVAPPPAPASAAPHVKLEDAPPADVDVLDAYGDAM